MAAACHSEIAVVLALLGLFSQIGGAVGQAIAGGIWTNTLPQYLQLYLPQSAKDQAMEIYASLTTQLRYPIGSPERVAIARAYGVGQRRMLIAAICILPVAALCVMMWRDIQLKTATQIRGTVV